MRMDCQRLATWKITWKGGKKPDRAFVCKDHLSFVLVNGLAGRPAGFDAKVAMHPITNEEPCEGWNYV